MKQPRSAEVESLLLSSGWFPGRRVDVARYDRFFQACGVPFHTAAEAAVAELDGLVVPGTDSEVLDEVTFAYASDFRRPDFQWSIIDSSRDDFSYLSAIISGS